VFKGSWRLGVIEILHHSAAISIRYTTLLFFL
jgi:hypothetical protein